MIKTDILRTRYSGLGIKVALIDTGYNMLITDKTEYIKHGQLCGQIIQSIAPNCEVTNIKIDVDNDLNEDSIIEGIKEAIKIKADIINISIGLKKCSTALYDICKEAFKNDIIIVAAKDRTSLVTYPADIEGVIDVDIIESDENKEIEIGKNKAIVNKKYIPFLKETKKEGSSFACAYMAAVLSLLLEARPFISKRELIAQEFDINVNHAKKIVENNSSKIKLPKDLAVLTYPIYDLDLIKYKKLFIKNIVSIFDRGKNEFINLGDRDNNKGFQNLLIINPNEYPMYAQDWNEIEDYKKKAYLGNFILRGKINLSYNKVLLSHNTDASYGMESINVPIVAIGSMGCRTGKFPVLVELYSQFISLSYNIQSITYNPLGVVFDFLTFEYPESITFPQIIFSINHGISTYLDKTPKELLIMDIPGSICKMNTSKFGLSDYGQLTTAYLNAFQVDIYILIVNYGVNPEKIFDQINFLRSRQIINIYLLISQVEITKDSLIKEYCEWRIADSNKYDSYVEIIKECFKELKCFTMSQFNDGELIKDIINELN